MQKSILNFSENVLSRDEMKQVKGGDIYCTISINGGGYNGYTDTGLCSGSTVDQCNTYAASFCSSMVSQGAYSSCQHECYNYR